MVIIQQSVSFFDILGPLEQKYESINVGKSLTDKDVIIEGIELFYLHSRSAYLFDQLGEYTWVGLNCAPLVEHVKSHQNIIQTFLTLLFTKLKIIIYIDTIKTKNIILVKFSVISVN